MDRNDSQARPRPVVLCILDGWGDRADGDANAIALAKLPTWTRLNSTQPKSHLEASEGDVGLPEGQMGNSEVGHMNLGGGRVLVQDLTRIDQAFADKAVGAMPAFRDFTAELKKSRGTCHVVGLLSPGGVHSHQDHLAALVRLVAAEGIPVAVHAFLDGRDTPPRSAREYLARFQSDIATAPGATIATVGGRYFAMDRDNRWERVESAYRCLVDAEGERAPTPVAAVDRAYATVGDEFAPPTVIGAYAGMKDGDGVLVANFRADRVRQILRAFVLPGFTNFRRPRVVTFAAKLGLTAYAEDLNPSIAALFPSAPAANILGQVVADAGLKQLRIAETEKYAHVTYFFNGGRETVFPGEERILVASPKVATYDLKPEMSADDITDRLVPAIESGKFDLIVVNYANADMVGHTGNLAAAMQAAKAVDRCLARLEAAVVAAGGTLLITADHGNAERMSDHSTGQPHTAHTLDPVPFLVVNGPRWVQGARPGRLADVAPTVLRLMGLPIPKDMTGRSLLVERDAQSNAAD